MLQNIKQTHIEKMRKKFETKPLIAPMDVRLIMGISRSTLNRLVNDGTLTPLCLTRVNNRRGSRRFELENVLNSFKKTTV